MERIIDFHAHAFPETIASKAVSQIGTHYGIDMFGQGMIAELDKTSAACGVEIVLLHATAMKPHVVRAVNDWLAAQCTGRFLGYGSLHPDMLDAEAELQHILSLGFLGIKLHSEFQQFAIDSEAADRLFSIVGSRLPFLVHVGDENSDASSPVRLARVLDRHPEIRVIAAHLGGYMQWHDAKKHLIGRPGLYLDTSSALWRLSPQQALEIIRAHGTKHVLFGTDYPVHTAEKELVLFNRLDLTPGERADVLYHNAASLLGRVVM